MEWSKEKINKVIWVVKVILLVSIVVGLLFCFGHWVFKIFGIGLLSVIVICFVLLYLKRVPEEQRWLTEAFGSYYRTLKPGLHWICPFVEKDRAFISVWEQRYPLFEKPIKVDFVDGSAVPKDAFAFVQCNEKEDPDAPYKMVYAILNIKEATVALIENAVRSYLNSKKIDEALIEGRGGYNILDKMPVDDVNGITGELRTWGLILRRVTIADFDLDATVVKARESIIKAESALKAVQYQKKMIAEKSVGALVEMKAVAQGIKSSTVERENRKDPQETEKCLRFGKDFVLREQAAENKSLSHNYIEVSGAEGIEKMVLDWITACQKPKSADTKKKRSEAEEEKTEE